MYKGWKIMAKKRVGFVIEEEIYRKLLHEVFRLKMKGKKITMSQLVDSILDDYFKAVTNCH